MSVGVILPALNAAPFIADVVGEIRRLHPEFRVLVVDDGSTDGTGERARAAGAEVITHEVNKGKGEALKTGYKWGHDEGIAWVFTMDSDGQHLPSEMQGFLNARDQGELDVVVGSRMGATEGMPWLRRKTNQFTSRVISRLAGQDIPDSQNGYRLYRTESLQDLKLTTSRYEAESEILVRLSRRGYTIGHAPVTTVYGDEVSSINPFVDTGRFFRLVFKLLIDRH